MKLSMNVTSTFFGNVVNDIKVAKEVGFDGIELQNPKMDRYLEAGYTAESVVPMLEGIEVSAFGKLMAVSDKERPSSFRGARVRRTRGTERTIFRRTRRSPQDLAPTHDRKVALAAPASSRLSLCRS